MSKKIAKNRKHTTIAILAMAISSMSVFLAMPNSTANAVTEDVLRITKIRPQRITVGELVSIEGIIEGKKNIVSVEITSSCSPNSLETAILDRSDQWQANFRFLQPRECEINANGKNNANPAQTIATDSFNVEVVHTEQVREILDEIEISSWKATLFWIGIAEALLIVIALWLILIGQPNIQEKLTAIDKNVKDIRLSSSHLPPQIEDIVPNKAQLGVNTLVTIKGINLDDKPEVLLRGISGDIRDIECQLTEYKYDEIKIQLPWAPLIERLKQLIGQKLPQNVHLIVRTAGGSVMRPFRLLNPTLKVNKPNVIPTSGGWYELTGEGFTVKTEVFDVDKNNDLKKGYMDSSTLIVEWPPEAASTKKKVTIRGEFGQSQDLTVDYSP